MTTNTASNLRAAEDSVPEDTRVECRPFVKWAGGKAKLLAELRKRLPRTYNRFFEPFVGGGALLFSVQPQRAHITDINAELMNAYTVVRDDVEALIDDLKEHVYEKHHFYQVRNIDRSDSYQHWSAVKKASRFIFLNKTCYNGLYRVNAKGHFNTPFGKYANPTIVDAENLRACSQALRRVVMSTGSFLSIEDQVSPGDVVYFDPPYMPLTDTANFTGYDRGGFSTEMQRELFALCCRLDKRGVKFLLSNSASPFITMLYQRFRVDLVLAGRAINSKGDKRGLIHEVIVRNY